MGGGETRLDGADAALLDRPPARTPLIARPGRVADADALYRLALAGGVGLTNLPPDRPALAAKLAASEAAVADAEVRAKGAPVLLIVEDGEGAIVATSCIFARVGGDWPFYSYRMTRQAQTSRTAARSVAQTLLHIANDFDGETEVGGLFVDPARRGGAAGTLAARARYLFIAQHRDWFGTRVIAELRGWQDEHGRSPVWDALGAHFYDMELAEADRFGALHGNQFIADLGPRYPIYVSMLPEAARAALGRPHDDGRRARDMLVAEGFRQEGYVDIFDGGPTLSADIDAVRTIAASRLVQAGRVDTADGRDALICAGQGAAFRAVRAAVAPGPDEGRVGLDAATSAGLGIAAGDAVRIVYL